MKHCSLEIIQLINFRQVLSCMKIFQPKFFIECLLFAYEFISFSQGKVMTLDYYLKKKTVLPNPNRNFPWQFIPIVIASMNPERDCEAEAGYSENYIATL